MTFADLRGANLREAELQGADLGEVRLQGAGLRLAELQGADLEEAQLQGAGLAEARLQGADLVKAHLQGADLEHAQLQGANLAGARLEGADLRAVELYGASLELSHTSLVDLRFARWTPPAPGPLAGMREILAGTVADGRPTKEALERIERTAEAGVAPPIFVSCLMDPEKTSGLNCTRQWLPAEMEAFQSELFPVLEGLACQSPVITNGLIRQIPTYEESSGRCGLAGRFAVLLDNQECEGLSSLPEADKNQIRKLAQGEEERHRGQSGAGKPAGEVHASPNPPSVIAPETP